MSLIIECKECNHPITIPDKIVAGDQIGCKGCGVKNIITHEILYAENVKPKKKAKKEYDFEKPLDKRNLDKKSNSSSDPGIREILKKDNIISFIDFISSTSKKLIPILIVLILCWVLYYIYDEEQLPALRINMDMDMDMDMDMNKTND